MLTPASQAKKYHTISTFCAKPARGALPQKVTIIGLAFGGAATAGRLYKCGINEFRLFGKAVWTSGFVRADLRLNVATARQRAPKYAHTPIDAAGLSDSHNHYHSAISRGSLKQMDHPRLPQ
jgi:hypothetical protein